MARKNPDQRRASHAWEVVSCVVERHCPEDKGKGKRVPDEAAKKFGTQAKKLPTRVLAAGLGQALAFLYAKDDAPILLQAINDWILNKPDHFDIKKAKEKKTLLHKLVSEWSSDDLRRATDEILAYMQWLNRFAEAEGLTDTEGGK